MAPNEPLDALFRAAAEWVRIHYPGHVARRLSLELDNGEKVRLPNPFSAAPPARHADTPPTHSEDFRAVTAGGQTYYFTPAQAAVVGQLWEADENGAPDVGQETLLEKAGVQSKRLAAIFRTSNGSPHPAWDRLIVAGTTRGTYRISFD